MKQAGNKEQPADLFDQDQAATNSNMPLAARMRPRTLDEFVGQEHITGPGKLLRRAIETDELRSAIFYGPPGCGKSSLAAIIARTTSSKYENFSAVTAGVADIRKIIDLAKERRKLYGAKTILFVDEIHRFNKAQQDGFLPHVEDGTIVLIGATTENPYFEVNSPLISRSRIFRFENHTSAQIERILRAAIEDTERGMGNWNMDVLEDALSHIVDVANGDARTALNALEMAAFAIMPDEAGRRTLTLEIAEEAIQQRAINYDKNGDNHYDVASAFIKSMRGSDPDAALYWLARMVYAGEIMWIFVSLTVSEGLGAFVTGIPEMNRHRLSTSLLNILHGAVESQVGCIAFRGAGHVCYGLREIELSFRHSNILYRMGGGICHYQCHGVCIAYVLRCQNNYPSCNETRILAGIGLNRSICPMA